MSRLVAVSDCGTIGNQQICQCLHALRPVFGRHNFVDEAHAISLFRIDEAAGQQQIAARLSPICRARKPTPAQAQTRSAPR